MSILDHYNVQFLDNKELALHGIIGKRKVIFDTYIVLPVYKTVDSIITHGLAGYDLKNGVELWRYFFPSYINNTFSEQQSSCYYYNFNNGIIAYVYNSEIYYFNRRGFERKVDIVSRSKESINKNRIRYVGIKNKFLLEYVVNSDLKMAWCDNLGNLENIITIPVNDIDSLNAQVVINPYSQLIEIWVKSNGTDKLGVYKFNGELTTQQPQLIISSINSNRLFYGNILPIKENNINSKITVESIYDSASYAYKFNNNTIGTSYQSSYSPVFNFDYAINADDKRIYFLTNTDMGNSKLNVFDITTKTIIKSVDVKDLNNSSFLISNLFFYKDKIIAFRTQGIKFCIYEYDKELKLMNEKIINLNGIALEYGRVPLIFLPDKVNNLYYYWR